jgi:hypothetical protein
MVASLWNHRGSQEMSLDELKSLPAVEETRTYSPLSHYDFIHNTHHIGGEILKSHGFELNSTKILVSKDGGRCFFILGYRNGADGIEMAAAGRNSTDKSMSVAISIGASARVIVCDNMMVTGDIVVFRRHTGNLFGYLREKLVLNFHEAKHRWRNVQADVEVFKGEDFDERDRDHFLMEAFRADILSPRQFDVAVKEVTKPLHRDRFGADSAWSAYNAMTEGLKLGPVGKVLERHHAAHEFTRRFVGMRDAIVTEATLGGDDTQQRADAYQTPENDDDAGM